LVSAPKNIGAVTDGWARKLEIAVENTKGIEYRENASNVARRNYFRRKKWCTQQELNLQPSDP
jgi:hypothetical protein